MTEPVHLAPAPADQGYGGENRFLHEGSPRGDGWVTGIKALGRSGGAVGGRTLCGRWAWRADMEAARRGMTGPVRT